VREPKSPWRFSVVSTNRIHEGVSLSLNCVVLDGSSFQVGFMT